MSEWNDAIEAAAAMCERWADEKVKRWTDTEREDHAKARAWDGLVLAAMIRSFKRSD